MDEVMSICGKGVPNRELLFALEARRIGIVFKK